MANKSQKTQPVRGRPQRSAAATAEMRSKIVEHAFQLFKDNGYDAISMRKLATAVGCTPKTLYAYFQTKFDILSVLWSKVFAELFDELDALALAEPDPSTRLEMVARGYVAYWLENPENYFLVFMSGGITRANVDHYIGEQVPRDRFEIFVQCLASAQDKPLSPRTLQLQSEGLICSLNGIAQAHITISGYNWSAPEALIQTSIKGLFQIADDDPKRGEN
jgi:AcrR family transcriptional regulator